LTTFLDLIFKAGTMAASSEQKNQKLIEAASKTDAEVFASMV